MVSAFRDRETAILSHDQELLPCSLLGIHAFVAFGRSPIDPASFG
jgi:hypothetical protein